MTTKEKIHTLSEFKEWVDSLIPLGGKMLYRGLSSTKYDLKSSMARRIEANKEKLDISKIWKVTSTLIEGAKMQGYDRDPTRRGETPATDFEILALLQHYEAATPLMDFSHNPFVALWFACQDNLNEDKDKDKDKDEDEDEDKNGRIITFNTRSLVSSKWGTNEINIKTDSITREGVKRVIEGGPNYELLNTEGEFWKFNPPGFDARILAQNSEFILGMTELKENEASETCVISKSAKKGIEQRLNDLYGISEERLFRDFFGYAARINSYTHPIKDLDKILAGEESAKQQKSTNFFDILREFTTLPFDDPKL